MTHRKKGARGSPVRRAEATCSRAFVVRSRGSAARTQARVWLEHVDELEKLVSSHDAFKLEPGPFIAAPYHVRLYPADDRQANHNALAPAKAVLAVGHEPVRRNVYDTQVHVTQIAMFSNNRNIDRMPRRAAHVGYR